MQTSEKIRPDQVSDSALSQHRRNMGGLQSYEVNQSTRTVLLFAEYSNMAVRFVTDEVIRIMMFDTNIPDWSSTIAVMELENASASPIQLVETDDIMEITGSQCKVVVNKRSLSFYLMTSNGMCITKEHHFEWNQQGTRCIGLLGHISKLYGLGETTGYLNKRGEKYTMWNSDVFDPHVPEMESLYQSIPFLIHFDGGQSYGLFVDNPGKCSFDMRSYTDAYEIQVFTGKFDMYFMLGPNLKQVISNYTALTGRISMPPMWALGYHQSRYSYKSHEEVLQVAKTFREKEIPCDVIYLDIHYMDEYRVFSFDKQHFPAPRNMIEQLKEIGFRVVPIVDPGVKKDPNYAVYREGIKNDYFCKKIEGELFIGEVWPGQSAFPDFTDDKVGQWWGELHKYYTELGIRGIWNDMNEPSVFNNSSKTMDLNVMHANNSHPKTHEELHNLYGLLMSKATFLGLKKLLDGERTFVLTRAGYAGIQRYAAVWTGDNRSFWEHLAMVMPMTLNLGLSGIPFCGTDIGGFGHHASGELVARWTQMGTFSPYCRNHSLDGTRYQEPWQFGEEIEAVCKQYIELRYRWLPYLYSLFYEASNSGLPILRPLLMEYPYDQQTYHLDDQFMVGGQVMVAPIYRPNTTRRAVYFPAGNWIDYWTGEVIKGGQYHLTVAPLNKLPIFIQSGAIIAETHVMQSTMDHKWNEIILNVYANEIGESTYEFYEDDGETYRYETGEYNLFIITREQQDRRLILNINQVHFGYDNSERIFEIRVKYLPFVPKMVQGLNLDNDSWYHDSAKGEVVIRTKNPSSKLEIMF